MLPPRPDIPQEEHCPVSEGVLGQLYRASAHGLDELIATVPAEVRAMLALYCYRRGHLRSIGLAIAASCEQCDLETVGGNGGKSLFEKARQSPDERPLSHYVQRHNVTLSTGTLRDIVRGEDSIA